IVRSLRFSLLRPLETSRAPPRRDFNGGVKERRRAGGRWRRTAAAHRHALSTFAPQRGRGSSEDQIQAHSARSARWGGGGWCGTSYCRGWTHGAIVEHFEQICGFFKLPTDIKMLYKELSKFNMLPSEKDTSYATIF
ncbi:unnamed protein product, partial [Urochloa humidicola]